jgi:hypothetical protein
MTNEPTRERLERALGVLKLHHKMLVNEIDGMTHDINESIDAFAVGIALANAELERQSVTDEDVAEAIEWLDEDRRNLERKVAHTSSFNAGIVRRELNRVRLAIQALQAYRPVEVKDGDVAFAIEELEELNNSLKLSRDGQRELGDEKEAKGFDDWIFANELAIKVLKTYRPEREPCNWCEAQMQNVMGYVQYGCYRLDASCWNFCPVCGRKLEKAVPV